MENKYIKALTTSQLMGYIGCSNPSLISWRKQGLINTIKYSGSHSIGLIYDYDSITQFIKTYPFKKKTNTKMIRPKVMDPSEYHEINGNYWSLEYHSKRQALKYSQKMINSVGNIDCYNLTNCTNCYSCQNIEDMDNVDFLYGKKDKEI
jgi:hypothetical protein